MRSLVSALLLFAACSITLHPARADSETSKPREDWQVIFLGGQRVGYSSSNTRTVTRNGQEVLISDTLVAMTIKRFGVSLKMIVRQSSEEDPKSGRLLSSSFISENPPISKTEMTGRAEGNAFLLETRNSGRVTKSRVEIGDDVRSPAWQERYLEEHPLKPGESATFKIFSPETAKVATISLKALEPGETKLLDGSVRKFDRTEMKNSITPGVDMLIFSEPDGKVAKLETNVLGMTTYAVSEAEALKAIPESELDIGLDGLIKVEVPDPHHAETVTYRITATSADPSTLFESGRDGQQVTRKTPSETLLTVSRVRPQPQPEPAKSLREANSFLDSDNPKVRALADEYDAAGQSPREIAKGLTHFVHRRTKNKTFSVAMATATEVAESLTGDCTEHSVLLAALLRAKGIPSRVAIGLVYVDPIKAFGGHMWTEAYVDGAWVPFDSALEIVDVRSGHLKMGDSDLSDQSPNPMTDFVKMIHLWSGATIAVVDPAAK
ncbi:transglutaminase-like domain-containing protein [Planctomyces sp. SH-PL14]|uniref:transglutaminase-like domain-containing protein n=1 Tax=Planctomyces sp. SH-PL14 TaxID=1632864 RepID=UPI00078D5F91|nr:transglutaminase-like domain-containing protein [Planctomyces sp. SH-PL14]AMV16893.1 Transglutaminase-like superfamily protein [Planctomyces sp. SH-PL14]